jgi:hypothetical protein
MRVAWERPPFTREDIDEWISGMPEALSHLEIDIEGTDWPERFGAIARLAVDGHGRLYVIPLVGASARPSAGHVPVDVFSADGEHLFSGLMEDFEWTAAAGHFVYGIRVNPQSGEREPVRYRLVAPF